MKYNIMLIGACMLLQIGQAVVAGEYNFTGHEVTRTPIHPAPVPWGPYEPWAGHGYAPPFAPPPHGLFVRWGVPGFAPWFVHFPVKTQWVRSDISEGVFSSVASGGHNDYELNDSGSESVNDSVSDSGSESVMEEDQAAPEEERIREEEQDVPTTVKLPSSSINYNRFLEFRKMTYDSPTSWASIP